MEHAVTCPISQIKTWLFVLPGTVRLKTTCWTILLNNIFERVLMLSKWFINAKYFHGKHRIFTSTNKVQPCSLVCLIGLSARLHKNYRTDFHKTWVKDEFWGEIDTINFWCRAGHKNSLSPFLKKHFSTFFVNISSQI